MLSEIVTAIPVPAFAVVKLPAFVKVTFAVSALKTPTKVPPVTVAVGVPLYTLLATVVPVTVSIFGVMLAVTLAG